MSTDFQTLEIPPGVVAKPTKKMLSTNYAEVNMVRWVDGQLSPIGGQSLLNYSFASNCRAVHGWFDLSGIYHIAYLCEANIYVDSGGALQEITPSDGLVAPSIPGIGGYSDGNYSDGTYGSARPGHDRPGYHNLPPAFSIDNFGSILLAMTSPDGRLLFWDPVANPSGRMAKVTTAPIGRSFVVTPDRFCMIFGMVNDSTGSARRFGWSDQEDYTSWVFTDVASQAGFYDIEPASPIVSAIAGKFGVLFFTGKKVYQATFSGLPYIYSYVELADNCTPWSPESIATTSAQVLWMSQQGLWSFDGTTVTPIPCLVRSWVDDDIDLFNVREFAVAVHNGEFNEFWWFFPQDGFNYNTRAMIYNYKEGWWSQARMSRSAGITSAYTVESIMADRKQAYIHETGVAYGNADLPWIETFDLNAGQAGKLITVKQMISDVEGAVEQIQYSLLYRNSRTLGTPEQSSPIANIRPNGYTDFRTTGRDIRIRMSVSGPTVLPFTVGQHLIDVVQRGDR